MSSESTTNETFSSAAPKRHATCGEYYGHGKMAAMVRACCRSSARHARGSLKNLALLPSRGCPMHREAYRSAGLHLFQELSTLGQQLTQTLLLRQGLGGGRHWKLRLWRIKRNR